MKNKIIFIDVDGPLAWGTTEQGRVSLKGSFVAGDFSMPYPWVKEDCDALKTILDQADARLVLSSDWKYHFSFYQMKLILSHYSISGDYLLDTTTHQTLWKKMGRCPMEWERASQIIKWVKENKPTHWIAIDDLNIKRDFRYLKVPQWRYVQVDGNLGEGHRLRDKVQECIDKLNR